MALLPWSESIGMWDKKEPRRAAAAVTETMITQFAATQADLEEALHYYILSAIWVQQGRLGICCLISKSILEATDANK